MAKSHKTLRSYRRFLVLLSPIVFIYTVYRALRDGGARYFRQRMGKFPARTDRPVWFHCASVGEVHTVAPLIQALRQRTPDLPVIITTTTPTGAYVAENRFDQDIQHYFLPIDWQRAVSHFLSAINPRSALFVETELWPNLYTTCAERNIPRVIINGRLTRKTLNAGKGILRAYAYMLNDITAVLARSDTDRERFIQLGAPEDRISVPGNLKLAPSLDPASPSKDLVGRPYWLASSTHEDEELQIARLWRRLKNSNYLLVIAPRHPQRSKRILRQLATLGAHVALRSRGDSITDETHIYLADTLGELPALMMHAALVVMGGSFIPHGGHNVLEPARMGKCIVAGPHMENFHEETQQLLQSRALIMAESQAQLAEALNRLLNNGELREEIGARARECVEQYSGITDTYLNTLMEYDLFQE